MFQAIFISVVSIVIAFGFIFLSSAEPVQDEENVSRVIDTPAEIEEYLSGQGII